MYLRQTGCFCFIYKTQYNKGAGGSRQGQLTGRGGNRRLPLAALNNRDFVVWTGHFVSLLSVIGGWGGVLPPHLGQKKSRRPFQISCSVCRCVGGGYLVVEIHQFEKSKLKTNIFFEFVSSGIPFTSINFVSFHIINN